MEYVSDLCQWGLIRMHWNQLWICLTSPPFRHCVCELSYILKDDKFEYNGKLHDLVTFQNFRIVFGIIQIHNVLIYGYINNSPACTGKLPKGNSSYFYAPDLNCYGKNTLRMTFL